MKKCKQCSEEIENNKAKFCSQSCSASFNNKNRKRKKKEISKCLNCNKDCARATTKYCSNKCKNEFQRKEIFEDIKNGKGKYGYTMYKSYLIKKFGEQCMECGWGEKNKFSNTVPIELEHIDGNSENNQLDNLKLLCPNCHSLTLTYGALNKGYGRKNRKR